MTPPSQSSAVWWRIVPKRSARDIYRRRFDSREQAEHTRALLRRCHTHKVVGYNAAGKRLP